MCTNLRAKIPENFIAEQGLRDDSLREGVGSLLPAGAGGLVGLDLRVGGIMLTWRVAATGEDPHQENGHAMRTWWDHRESLRSSLTLPERLPLGKRYPVKPASGYCGAHALAFGGGGGGAGTYG